MSNNGDLPDAVPIASLEASASLSLSDANLMESGAKTGSLRNLSGTGGSINDESPSAMDLSEASASFPTVEELQTDTSTNTSGRKHRRRTFSLVALCLIVAGLCVGLGFGLAKRQDGKSSNTSSKETPNVQGEQDVPGLQELAKFERVVQYLVTEKVSDEMTLLTVGTPQHKAATWIADYDGANLSVPTTSLVSQDNREAYLYIARYVMALNYFSLNGPNWHYQLEFMTDKYICDWNEPSYGIEGANFGLEMGGVICSDDSGLPVAMDFELNNVTGTLPTENGLLTSLLYIDLDYNSVDGTLPTELCNLSNLQYLLLKQNSFEGEVPSCMTNWKDMKVLDLLFNQFEGEIPGSPGFCAFKDLQMLGLDKNFFYGSFPDCILDLSNLIFLSLSDNSLTGEIPDLEPLAGSLQQLFLDGNKFVGNPISKVNELKNLTHLYLENNKFEGDIQDIATGMDSLMFLDLSSNLFTSSSGFGVPLHLLDLPSLRVLDLSNNQLQGSILDNIPATNQLAFFSVHKNLMTGTIPLTLRTMNGLIHLDLANNDFVGPMPAEVFQIPGLSTLFLSENPGLDPGPIPSDISAMTQLREISLKNTNRDGPLPELLDFFSLFILDLDNNDLTGTIPANYGMLPSLRHLLLNRNPLSGPVPAFTDMPNLGTVLVDGTDLTGNLSSICDLPGFTGEVELATDIIAIADCAGENPEIECSCCHCCDKADGGCSDPVVASLDWTWEYGLTRTAREFEIDLSFLQPPEDPPADSEP